MTAAELLNQYGLTVQQASDWIRENVGNSQLVYNTALEFGVDSSMLAEIVSSWVPGANADLVENFFTSQGLNGSALNSAVLNAGAGGDDFGGGEILPEDLAALASLITLNTYGGQLSTEALRAGVLNEVSNGSYYYQLFNPANYEGADDGTFTADELGIPGLGNLAATTENLESLYYGTLIKVFKAIDMEEISQIADFAQANASALEAGSPAVLDQYVDLMLSVLEDPAVTPMFPDDQLAQTIIFSTVAVAELVGGGDPSALFDDLFTGFI